MATLSSILVQRGAATMRAVEDAIHAHDLVLVDDLHLLTYIVERHNDPRRYLLDAALTALLGEARALNKTLVFAGRGEPPWSIARRAVTCKIEEFAAADCECV